MLSRRLVSVPDEKGEEEEETDVEGVIGDDKSEEEEVEDSFGTAQVKEGDGNNDENDVEMLIAGARLSESLGCSRSMA